MTDLELSELEKSIDALDAGGNFYSTPYSIGLLSVRGTALKSYVSHVKQLPQKIFQLTTDQSTARYLNENLAPRFRLDGEQAKELTRIVRDVLISRMYIGDLATEIQARMRVEAGMAREIGNVLVGELFKPVMADIKALQLAHFADRISGGRTAQPPPATPAPQQPVKNNSNVINLRTHT